MKRWIRSLLIATLLGAASLGAHAQNWYGTAMASAARTTTTNSADIDNPSARGVQVIITVTAYTSGTWTPVIQGKNITTGAYYTIFTGGTINSVGTTVIKVYPGLTAATNVGNDVIPKTWRIQMSGASTPVSTFSVGWNSIQ